MKYIEIRESNLNVKKKAIGFLNVMICPNVQVLLRWEGKSNYRTTCAGREGGKYWESKSKSRAPGVSSYVALAWPHF